MLGIGLKPNIIPRTSGTKRRIWIDMYEKFIICFASVIFH